MSKNHYIIPIFVPHKGCPYDCIFCNQKKITGIQEDISSFAIEEQIKEYLKQIDKTKDKHLEIAFFGGSFTGIDIRKQRELLTVAWEWKQKGVISDIRISTRPDYINPSILEFLMEYGVSIIELGVQSMDKEVLKISGRGHTSDDVNTAVKILRKFPVKIGLQMMIGLPGDNLEKNMETANKLIELKPDFVRIYPTLVVRDTYLEQMYFNGIYKPLGIDTAVDISKKLLLKFMKHSIPVIRIGLQPTEDILLGKEVLGGPFHPSFRQLVETEIYKDFLNHIWSLKNVKKKENMEVQVNSKCISNLVGHKKKNINFIKEKYKIEKVKIVVNDTLDHGEIILLKSSGEKNTYTLLDYISKLKDEL